MQNKTVRIFLGVIIAIAVLVGLYYLPPVHSRLAWRVDNLRTQIKYYFNPPEEAVFQPSAQEPTGTVAQATLEVLQTLAPTAAPPGLTSTPPPTLTPTAVPTPLPESVALPGVIYVDQHNRWNYCGPANLTMALKFWGWEGNRDDVAKAVKPGVDDESLDFIQRGKADKNVMPYEMAAFVNDQTEFRALTRYGGDIDLVKRFVAAGFPVLAEKGYYEADYTGKIAWLGHYQFVTGYDEAEKKLIVQDTWNDGPNFRIAYDTFDEGWRSFDYLFMLVYPPDREQEIFDLLGPWSDEMWANQHALEVAEGETQTLDGIDEFFAWFNTGTSLVQLQRYAEAAEAYDRAFGLYAQLGQDNQQRPYRIMWYQTGPYWAYYYAGRYQDVINLANTTLNETISEPTLEESLYWRAMAEYATGDFVSALADMREAVRLNPNFSPGIFQLGQWGG
ncbi:MAG: tetratricopeptide repeat protein [Chloroflexi bacterium]|nr:tetratricopeptide repeat protein [Chloroflexota bacterium]